jgi:hypothetical protein
MLHETVYNQCCIITCSDAFACQARTQCHSPCSGSQHGLASTVSGPPHVPPQLPTTHQNGETLQPRAAPHCTPTPAEIPFVQFRAIWVSSEHVSPQYEWQADMSAHNMSDKRTCQPTIWVTSWHVSPQYEWQASMSVHNMSDKRACQPTIKISTLPVALYNTETKKCRAVQQTCNSRFIITLIMQ